MTAFARLTQKFRRAAAAPRRLRCAAAGLALAGVAGCAHDRSVWEETVHNDTCRVDAIAAQIDAPIPPLVQQVAYTQRPTTVRNIDESAILYVDRSLGEVLRAGLEYSTVVRDLGGVVLRSPDTVNTTFAGSLASTDPRFGDDAALSQFDARLRASANYENNDRIFNNAFFAGGTTAFQQDLHEYDVELSKISATGSRFALRGYTEYDANNAPANTFASAYQNWLEGEVRQPLLQGGGVQFNRIAGPNAVPGLYNGLLIARANIDIEQSDFEAALRDYVSNVENAYWDLYLSYRELDARKKAMERALLIWNETKAKVSEELVTKSKEALARQQYYRLKAEVDEALSGRLLQGTQTRNGSDGGTLQQASGVLAAERRLRLLIGLPASDGQLIRPSDEPTMGEVNVDWDTAVQEAVTQRPELIRQTLQVKKREMELLAAKNFLNPRLDAVARYRMRGFGDDLINHGGTQRTAAPSSSVGNLFTGDQQEWAMGVELSMPIGFRQAHAAVTNAELQLSRARAVQVEQQREIVSNLSAAVTDAARAYQAQQNNLNRYLAAKEYFEALLVQKEEKGLTVEPDRFLDAQERLVRSEVDFFRSRAEYAVALKNVHFEKGTLMQYKDMRLAEDGAFLHGTFEAMPPAAEWIDAGSPLPMPEPVDEPVEDVMPDAAEDAPAPLAEDDESDVPAPPEEPAEEAAPQARPAMKPDAPADPTPPKSGGKAPYFPPPEELPKPDGPAIDPPALPPQAAVPAEDFVLSLPAPPAAAVKPDAPAAGWTPAAEPASRVTLDLSRAEPAAASSLMISTLGDVLGESATPEPVVRPIGFEVGPFELSPEPAPARKPMPFGRRPAPAGDKPVPVIEFDFSG